MVVFELGWWFMVVDLFVLMFVFVCLNVEVVGFGVCIVFVEDGVDVLFDVFVFDGVMLIGVLYYVLGDDVKVVLLYVIV